MRRLVLGALCIAFGACGAFAATRTVTWELPEGWDAGVSYPKIEGYRAILADGFGRRNGLGEVGEPDLPFKAFAIDVKKGGTVRLASVEAAWTEVEVEGGERRLPMPIVELVKVGEEAVIPELSKAYKTVYPTNSVDVGSRHIYRNQESFTVRVTPFKWDGEKKTLYRASKLKVEVEVEERTPSSLKASSVKLQSSSANAEEQAANFIILAPHKFYNLWCAYAEFRKNSKGGLGLTFKVKDLNELYEEFKPSEHINGYTKKPDYELCIHKWLEKMYAQTDAKGEPVLQYILLGGTPAKYSFNPEEHIPSRRFSAVATNGYMSDTYYGCMDKFDKSGQATTEGEVWDFEGDGVYMAELQPAGWIKCSAEVTKSVDWDPDVPVFRFPLMSAVKDGTGAGVYQTAEQIMDTFTNRIAWAESDDFPEAARSVYANTGGTMHHGWNRGETRVEVTGEREFFEGRLNVFDPAHATPYQDSEIYSRHHVPDYFSVHRGWKDNSTIHTCNYNPNTYAEIYSKSGEIVNNLAHGWARGADPMSAPQAYSATGFYRAYIIGNSCDCGMFDYCPDGSYGITNCICLGEAPILNPNPHCGALVSYTNARFGYGDNYTVGGSDCMDHYINAGWAGFDGLGNYVGEMNGAQAHISACQQFQRTGYPSCQTVNGVCEMEIICHGDPLVKLTPQTNAVNSTDFLCVREFSYDATGGGVVTFNRNSTSAGFYLTGNNGKVTLNGEGRYRSTRETALTNVAELVWEVEGGAGRNGIRLVNARGNLTLPGNARRYFGQAFKNVGDIVVSGGNVVLDFPSGGNVADFMDFDSLAFVSPALAEEENYNVIRTRQQKCFRPGKTIAVVSNRLDLQTWDIAAVRDNDYSPLFTLTNAILRVSPGPFWKTECFERDLALNNSQVVGNSDSFYFGGSATKANGFQVRATGGGVSSLGGSKSIRLEGRTVVTLEAGSAFEIGNKLVNGATEGSLEFKGEGTVKFLTVPGYTGETLVGAGVTLESADGLVLPNSVTVAANGAFKPQALPISGVGTMTLETGAKLVLPAGEFHGVYQLVNPLESTIDFAEGVVVTDADGRSIEGRYVQGTFIETAQVLTWANNGAAWTTDAGEEAWLDATGAAAAFENGRPVKFPDRPAPVTVTLAADVAPGFMDFDNPNAPCAIAGDHTIALNAFFGDTDIAIAGTLKTEIETAVSGGRLVVGTVVSPLVEVGDGATFAATKGAKTQVRNIKRLKFTFSAAQNSNERVAVKELRLFRDANYFAMPSGTIIRDCAGQEIRIDSKKDNDWAYNYTWLKGKPADENESLKALVDNSSNAYNKWWASKSASPTWFEVEFPSPEAVISGYDLCTADHAPRNAKAWSVAYAEEGGAYVTLQNVSGLNDSTAQHWMKGNGTGSQEVFPLMRALGETRVLAGGTLYATGTSDLNLSFAAGSTLAVTNTAALVKGEGVITLALPAEGNVTIDTREAARTSDWFKILGGYNVTDAQFLKFAVDDPDAALKLVDGDIYLVTTGVHPSPYTAEVSGEANWNTLGWTADGQATGKNWDQMITKSDGEAKLYVEDGTSTLTVDASAMLSTLILVGNENANLTLCASGLAGLSLRQLDASAFLGTLTIELPLKATDIIAGPNTIIDSQTAMTGTLTIGPNMKATLESGTSVAKLDVTHPSAWLRLNGNRGNVSLAGLAEGRYSYEKANLTAGLDNANVTMVVEEGDAVTIVGSSSNNNGANILNWDIRGGNVTLNANATTTSWGRSGSGVLGSTFMQAGGTFRVVMTNSGRKFTMGNEGPTDGTNPVKVIISGGAFIVEEGILCLNRPTGISLSGDAVMSASGYQTCGQKGSLAVRGDARVEVGSQGFASDTASVEFEGGTLLATGGSVLFAEEVNLLTVGAPTKIAAVAGATIQLNGLNGSGTVAFGDYEKDWTGGIIVAATISLPAHFTLDGAMMDLGKVRSATTGTHVLDAYPANGGKIAFTMNETAKTAMLRCGDFVNDLTDDEIKAMLVITRNGTVLEPVQWTASVADNILYFSPESASGYIFPVCAYALSNYAQNWSDLNWADSAKLVADKKYVYKADWPKVKGGSATISHTTGAKTLNLDVDVNLASMRVSNTYGTMTFNCSGNYALNVTKELYLADGSMEGVKNTFIGNVTVGSLRCNALVEFGGTVAGEVTVPANGSYTQTAGSFGSLNLGAGATANVTPAIKRDELTITGIAFKNATKSAITISPATFDLGASYVKYDNATLTITEDVTWARYNEIVAATKLDASRFAFASGVTLDCGTGRNLANVPTACKLRFQLTEAEGAGLIAGVALFDAGGKSYALGNITVVDHDGEPISNTSLALEDGKVVFKRNFDGTAYTTVTASSDWFGTSWKDSGDYAIRKQDWGRVQNVEVAAKGVEITLNDALAIPGYMRATLSSGNITKYNLNADLSVGSLDTGSDGYRRITFTKAAGMFFVTNGLIRIASLGNRVSFYVNGKVWARGVRDVEPTVKGNNDANVSGTLMIGREGLTLSSRTSFGVSFGIIGAYEDATVDAASDILVYTDGKFMAEAGATLTVNSKIVDYNGKTIAVSVFGGGTTVFAASSSYSGTTTVTNGTLKLGNVASLGTSVVTVSGGVLEVGELRIANAVTFSGGKVKVVLTDAEAKSAGLIELFGFGGGDLKSGVEVVDCAGNLVQGYFKVVNNKACFGVGEEPAYAYKMPLSCAITPTTAGHWKNLSWTDANGVEFDKSRWEETFARKDLAMVLTCNGGWPTVTGLTDADWKGTLKLTGSIAAAGQTFSAYGNAKSSIEIAGSIGGYLLKAGSCSSKIIVNGTLTFSNGYSTAGGYAFNGALSGSGTIATSGTQSDVIKFLGDVADFTGTIKVAGSHCVAFGEQADDDKATGKVVINKDYALHPGQTWSAASGIVVKNGVTVGYDGKELAKCAVSGVPYRTQFTTSTITGTIATPMMPNGYAALETKTGGYAVVVTAPAKAKFGAISLNLHNGTVLTGAGNHGLYHVPLADWGNLKVANNASITVGGAKFALSSSVSGYGLNNNPLDMIYKQYMDDSSSTRTITITGVPYVQYRLIVYYSTDTANYNFRPVKVNNDWYAGSTASKTTANPTVKGRNEVWGHSGPNHNANDPAEGVNALMTDVCSGDVTLSFTRNGGAGARATPCAIQIVKVGEIVPTPVLFWLR